MGEFREKVRTRQNFCAQQPQKIRGNIGPGDMKHFLEYETFRLELMFFQSYLNRLILSLKSFSILFKQNKFYQSGVNRCE